MNTVTIEYDKILIMNAFSDFASYMYYGWEENVFPNSDIPFVDDAPEGKSYLTIDNKTLYFFKEKQGIYYYIDEKDISKYLKEFFFNVESYIKYYSDPEKNINVYNVNPIGKYVIDKYKNRINLHYASLKTDLEFIQEEIKERVYLSFYEFLEVLHHNSVISLIPLNVE